MIEVLGDRHRDTVGAMNSLAYSYWKLGRLAESEKTYIELIAIQKEQNGTDFRYYYTQSLLGEVLTDMKKYPDAEPVLLEGYKGMEKTVPKNDLGRSQLRFAIERLVDLYGKWGKPDKVKSWQQKYEAIKASDPATKAPKK